MCWCLSIIEYKRVVHISSGANAQMVIISGILTANCITV